MANKAIFDVDVNDAKFKAFATLVDKYYDQLTKMPTAWQNANAAMAPNAVVAALGAQNQLLSKFLEGEKAVASETERTERSWRGISEYTRSAANSLYSTVLSLAKWTGISAVLGSIVGAISLDRVAASVADTRRTAAGLGISYGQQQAFGLDLGRFVDPGAVLSAGRNALFDLTSPAYVALRAAGITPGAKDNAATVGASLLERLPQLLGGTPQGLIGPRARALGLDQFLSLDNIVNYLGANPQERRQQLDRYREDARNLDLQKQVTRGWQDFYTSLQRAETGIENTFVKGLGPLTGPLEHLTGSVEKATEIFLSGASKWIGPLGDGIEKFARYLVSPDFVSDLESFKSNVGDIASAIADAAKWIRSVTPSVDRTAKAIADPLSRGMFDTAARVYGPATRHFTTGDIAKALQHGAQLPPNQGEIDLLALIGDLEKSGDNAVSPKGAIGRYQITPDTARTYGRDPGALPDPGYNAATATLILRDLVRRYHGDLDKVLAAYHSGRGAVEDPGKFPLGPEGRGYLNRAHGNPGYQKVIIEIHDATGGNPITASAQTGLGGTP